MSVEATSWVWKHSQATGLALTVLLRIADQADSHGANAWPGMETLRRDCRVAKRDTLRLAIRKLEDMGELIVFKNAGGNQHTRSDRRPNRYDLPMVPGYKYPEWAGTPEKGTREMGRIDADEPPSDGSPPNGTTPPPREDDPPFEGSYDPPSKGDLSTLVTPGTTLLPTASAHDQIFAALVNIEHANIDELTKSAQGKFGQAAKQLVDIGVCDPGEVAARAAEYERQHPDWVLTACSLVKHWPSLDPVVQPRVLTQFEILNGQAGAA